jgi:replicative DNA helicase
VSQPAGQEHLDEADQHKRGELPADPAAKTKLVAAEVPRVYTVREIMTAARERAFSAGVVDFCTTGHFRLDDITGGIRGGNCWLFGADTSFGKTAWLVQICDENMKLKKRPLIISSEDTKEMYGARLLIRRSRVDAKRFRDKKLDASEKDRVLTVEAAGLPQPVFIDARKWAVEDLEPHVAKIVREEGIDFICWDYVQEFKSKRRWQDERVKYREIAKIQRNIAKDAGKSSVIFSQLTMDKDTKIPTRANIRECRDLANASEVILIGFEPNQNITNKKGYVVIPSGTKCVYVDKVKDGPRCGKVPMPWDKYSATFETVLDADALKAALQRDAQRRDKEEAAEEEEARR